MGYLLTEKELATANEKFSVRTQTGDTVNTLSIASSCFNLLLASRPTAPAINPNESQQLTRTP